MDPDLQLIAFVVVVAIVGASFWGSVSDTAKAARELNTKVDSAIGQLDEISETLRHIAKNTEGPRRRPHDMPP